MKQQLNLSIETELIEQLETLAAKQFRSRSNMLEVLIREACAADVALDAEIPDAQK